MKKKYYPGINIQWPISESILLGEKTVETRTYQIPKKYLGTELLMIETPGKSGKFKARIVALITFSACFEYATAAEFYRDRAKHLVDKNSPWSWRSGQKKWAWNIASIQRIQPQDAPNKKGIRFTNKIQLNSATK